MNAETISDEPAMMPLHRNQISVLRIRSALSACFLLLLAMVLDLAMLRDTPLPSGLLTAAVALLGLFLVVALPPRRYRAWSYREEEDELHIASGLLVRTRTVVPFGRVQHIDIAQGPLERRYGLGTLILHTAGTRGASVPLPGLERGETERMRDRIRGKIRSDLA